MTFVTPQIAIVLFIIVLVAAALKGLKGYNKSQHGSYHNEETGQPVALFAVLLVVFFAGFFVLGNAMTHGAVFNALSGLLS